MSPAHENVVLDDFYGWIPYHMFLNICDRYPVTLPVKGAHVIFKAKNIYITSNKEPKQWYKEEIMDIKAIMRRIDRYFKWSELFQQLVVVENEHIQ